MYCTRTPNQSKFSLCQSLGSFYQINAATELKLQMPLKLKMAVAQSIMMETSLYHKLHFEAWCCKYHVIPMPPNKKLPSTIPHHALREVLKVKPKSVLEALSNRIIPIIFPSKIPNFYINKEINFSNPST